MCVRRGCRSAPHGSRSTGEAPSLYTPATPLEYFAAMILRTDGLTKTFEVAKLKLG